MPEPESQPVEVHRPEPGSGLGHYLLVTYGLLVCHTSLGLDPRVLSGAWVTAYAWLIVLTYAGIYLVPAGVLTLGARRLLVRRPLRAGRAVAPWRSRSLVALAVGATALTHIAIFADRGIYELFGFHVNGFVWNLVVTPGGLDSLGASGSTKLSYAAIAAGFVALQALVAALVLRPAAQARLDRWLPRRRYVRLAVLLLVATLGERITYGISDVLSHTHVLVVTDSFPLYARTSLRSFAKSLGIEAPPDGGASLDVEGSRLSYPLEPLRVVPPERPLNIVWLTAESLRADMLDPEIMPATWRFAQRAHRFTRHYSGGNGTRMGMFSMFYGLYGSYWFAFLKERRGPVLIDVLNQLGYEFELRTSARFTYPEFDKTLFAAVPAEAMHEEGAGEGWVNDRANVDGLVDFLTRRDAARPFLAFLFFESPHAKYYFPPESVIRPDYLPDLNYATMDLERDIEGIRNRYINAVHHLDSQFGRILDTLEQTGQLDHTIVVITGDHGEEFMEKGRWGHNSAYTEEQILVPLVLWVPGTGASVVTRMTSHLDLAPTILPRLGLQNPPGDYSLGFDLLGSTARRHTIIADWSSVCFVDAHTKQRIWLKMRSLLDRPEPLTDRDDRPLGDDAAVDADRSRQLLELMFEMGRFVGGGAAPDDDRPGDY